MVLMPDTATTTPPRAPTPQPGSRRIAKGLLALMRRLWAYERGGGFLQAIEESGLSLTQVKALLVLDAEQGGPRPIRELGEELGITAPAATRAVDGLVERRLVSRSEDPVDRRVRRIAITDAGRRLVAELASRRAAGLEAFAEGLSPVQQRKLLAALEALLEGDAVGPRPGGRGGVRP
jgi:DNA-binding MarR family transcriptional regulator